MADLGRLRRVGHSRLNWACWDDATMIRPPGEGCGLVVAILRGPLPSKKRALVQSRRRREPGGSDGLSHETRLAILYSF